MNVVFWVLWCINLVLTFVFILAGIYRENAGAFTNNNTTFAFILLLILLGSIVVRYVLQWPQLSLLLAALPLLIVLTLYFLDR